MNIYKEKELVKPNFFHKLFNKTPKQNALIEINNLFSLNQTNIEKITLDNILQIAEKYKVNIKKKYKQFRLDLFSSYLHNCLVDKKLEDFEINVLKHLKNILLLNELDTQQLLKQETEKIYDREVKEAVKDGRLDEFEKKNLEKIKRDLLISEDISSKIYESSAKEIIQKFIEEAISDERLSPDEEKEMNEIAKSLCIDLKIDEKTKETLDRYRLYWQIENSDLPVLTSEINLQKSESLHFKAHVKWLEQRRVTKRINYGGPTARIKLAKGVYYRVGNVGAQSVSEDVWQTIDSGNLYLTNKRLIFMGSKGNKTIPFKKILDFKPFKNGVDIQKETGKSPFIEFKINVDVFSMILARLMNE